MIAIVLVTVAAAWAAGMGMAAPSGGGGSLLAFGSNITGQLGNATNNLALAANPTPAQVLFPGQIGTVTQIAAGTNHSLVMMSSGQLYAFGSNQFGQLGITTTNTGTYAANPTPTLVTLPGEVGTLAQISAGAYHSLALTSSGQLYAFGSNQYGQLGFDANQGTTTANPTPALVTLPGQIGTITAISAGGLHSLVITSSGQLYAFGHNQYGQLGNTTNTTTMTANPTPTLVTLPGQVGAVTQVAAGGYHSLAVTSSGQLYSFGWNYNGQLGNATGDTTNNPNPTPTLVTLPAQDGAITQVAASAYHSLVLTSTGQLYAFGSNAAGQLGNTTNTNSSTPNPTPALVTLPGQVGAITQIAATEDNSYAVTASGQLYGFGDNYWGQLATTTNNLTFNANPTPTLIAFEPGTTIDTVAKGSSAYQTLALVSDLALAGGALPSALAGKPYQAMLTASGGTAPLTWSATGLPPGLSIDAKTGGVSGTPTGAGSTAVVTVTDVYGSTTSASYTVDVVIDDSHLAPPPLRAPQLKALKQSASKWLAGTKLPSLNGATKLVKRAGVPVGTTFSFSVDNAARVTFAFKRTASGRRVAGKCVAKTKGNASKPVCTRTLAEGTLRVQAKQGTSRLHFEGRINRLVKLRPGRHSVLITATSNGKTSPVKSLHFTVLAG